MFWQLTEGYVYDLYAQLERRRRLDLNIQSLSTARFAAAAMSALGSKDSKPDHFLPYPGVTSADGSEAFSPATKKAIERLIESGRLPPAAAGGFKQFL